MKGRGWKVWNVSKVLDHIGSSIDSYINIHYFWMLVSLLGMLQPPGNPSPLGNGPMVGIVSYVVRPLFRFYFWKP